MKDLMLDIETMGNSSHATIIQLAAVFFDRDTGELGEEFCVNIDQDNCESLGFVSDESTKEWWEKQNQEVLASIRADAQLVLPAISSFYDFYNLRKDVRIWSHATFDFVIVQNYLKIIQANMNHRNARDIRTLVDLSGINLDSYDWKAKTHNALDDCKFQVRYCVDAMTILKNR